MKKCLTCRFQAVAGQSFCAACAAELEQPVLLTFDGLAHQAKRLMERRLKANRKELTRLSRLTDGLPGEAA